VSECRIVAGLTEQETTEAMGILPRSAQRPRQEARVRQQGFLPLAESGSPSDRVRAGLRWLTASRLVGGFRGWIVFLERQEE
jgi:hypothetical protein